MRALWKSTVSSKGLIWWIGLMSIREWRGQGFIMNKEAHNLLLIDPDQNGDTKIVLNIIPTTLLIVFFFKCKGYMKTNLSIKFFLFFINIISPYRNNIKMTKSSFQHLQFLLLGFHLFSKLSWTHMKEWDNGLRCGMGGTCFWTTLVTWCWWNSGLIVVISTLAKERGSRTFLNLTVLWIEYLYGKWLDSE